MRSFPFRSTIADAWRRTCFARTRIWSSNWTAHNTLPTPKRIGATAGKTRSCSETVSLSCDFWRRTLARTSTMSWIQSWPRWRTGRTAKGGKTDSFKSFGRVRRRDLRELNLKSFAQVGSHYRHLPRQLIAKNMHKQLERLQPFNARMAQAQLHVNLPLGFSGVSQPSSG